MPSPAKFGRTVRPALLALGALVALLLAAGASQCVAQPRSLGRVAFPAHPMVPVTAMTSMTPMAAAGQQRPGYRPGTGPGPRRNQEHLAQWMDRHSNLSLADQQRALQNEPGFRELPEQTQQRMMNRLTQLNNMSPDKRRRVIERTEAMERLTLPERQQVRSAMQQLGSLPEDRRRLVARAFRDLREMPEPQRQAILSSGRFQLQFSGEERSTLSNLLAVEPFLPVPAPKDGPSYGK